MVSDESKGGGTPLDSGRHLEISQVSLDGLGCPTAENEATGQGVHFWCILAIGTLLGSREFVKMWRSAISRSPILGQIPTKITAHYSRHQDLSLSKFGNICFREQSWVQFLWEIQWKPESEGIFPIGFPLETRLMTGHRMRYSTALKSHNFLMRKYFSDRSKIE